MSRKKNPQLMSIELEGISALIERHPVFKKIEIEYLAPSRRRKGIYVLFSNKNNSRSKSEPQEAKCESRIVEITSPCVGFFTGTFVKVGDVVNKDQVLCVLEEVKIKFVVVAGVAGEIVGMFPPDAYATGYGETLFKIKVFKQ